MSSIDQGKEALVSAHEFRPSAKTAACITPVPVHPFRRVSSQRNRQVQQKETCIRIAEIDCRRE